MVFDSEARVDVQSFANRMHGFECSILSQCYVGKHDTHYQPLQAALLFHLFLVTCCADLVAHG